MIHRQHQSKTWHYKSKHTGYKPHTYKTKMTKPSMSTPKQKYCRQIPKGQMKYVARDNLDNF